MNITDGLKYFIGSALVKSKRERFIGFLSNAKSHKKFLASLDHDLEKLLDCSKIVFDISMIDMEEQGDLYCSNGVSNDSDSSMENLYDKAPWEGGWLLINKQGSSAIYRPEGRIDDEIYIKL